MTLQTWVVIVLGWKVKGFHEVLGGFPEGKKLKVKIEKGTKRKPKFKPKL